MTYKQTLEFLNSQLPAYHRIGKAAYRKDLDNILKLDKYLNYPHKKYRIIHVGGTNGKGSVSHMISSVLMEAGYKTGLYTSPHLREFRERIKVNGKMIPKSSVKSFLTRHNEIIRMLKPSFFEMSVAMAFEFFAENKVDTAVIEVGLGGRLDSTNIITPVLSVITNVGHDHMDLLGDSIKKIATEKAGIIKSGIPVVISETQSETETIFRKRARETGSEIYFADQEFFCDLLKNKAISSKRGYKITERLRGTTLTGKTGLGGDYQSRNIQAVYEVFNVLQGLYNVNERNIIDGIDRIVFNTRLEGRWQVLDRIPLTICDTGHNREGLEYVLKQVRGISARKLHIIIGFVMDKDLSIILPLFPVEASYYFTKASVPRALDERILMAEAVRYGLNGACFPDAGSALVAARKEASDADLIFIGGSTFVVADILEFMRVN